MGTMKRSLRIGIGVATLALIAAACGGNSNDLAESIVNSQSGDATIDVSRDGETITIETEDVKTVIKTDSDGNVSVEGASEDGETVFSSGGDIPDDLPLPVAPGGTVSLAMTTPDGSFYSIVYPSDMFDELAELYTEYLNSAPGEPNVSNGTAGGSKWFNGVVQLEDGTFLGVSVIETDEEAIVTLTTGADS